MTRGAARFARGCSARRRGSRSGWFPARHHGWNGFYSFPHVAAGGHFIEFNFQSTKPFWFTGPSKRNATINIPANLGIRFASAELVGYIRNDAELGVEGARIVIAGTNQRLEVRSDAQGRFSVPALGAGD